MLTKEQQAELDAILALPDGPQKIARARRLRGQLALAGQAPPDALKAFEAPLVLETVDIAGVDIMTADERVFGTGSPPEGDVFTAEELQGLADRSNLHADALKPANKIGHSFEQRLASTVGLTPGEMPALGWLHNYRVAPDAKGRTKVYVDIKAAPAKFAALVKAGAFRTRSPELRSRKVDGVDTGVVIDGLAWHGAQASAFKTLDDVFMLYADEGTYARVYAEDEGEAAVAQWAELDPDAALEAAARIFGDRITVKPTAADTYGQMELSTAQQAHLRKTLGLADDAPLDKIFEALDEQATAATGAADQATELDAAKKRVAELEAAAAKPEAGVTFSEEEAAKLREQADQGARVFEEQRVATRDRLFSDAVNEGQLEPADVDALKASYDESPAMAAVVTKTVKALPVNDEWKRVYGSDGDGVADGEGADDFYAAYAALDGGPSPSLEKAKA